MLAARLTAIYIASHIIILREYSLAAHRGLTETVWIGRAWRRSDLYGRHAKAEHELAALVELALRVLHDVVDLVLEVRLVR